MYNPYKASEGNWFMLVVTPDKFQALATAIDRPDLTTDPRYRQFKQKMQSAH